MVFAQSIFKILLVLHLAAAVVLLGSSTHNVLVLIGMNGKSEKSIKVEQKFAAISFYAFLVCFIIGMVVYPAFRHYVQALYFEASLPWATGMFEIKEHLLALAFVAGLGHYLLRGRVNPFADKEMRVLYKLLAIVFWAIVVYSSISGAALTMFRSY